MKGSRAAQRYAKALFELASENKIDEAVKDDMISISKTIDVNPELKNTLLSPVIKASIKSNILQEVFKAVNPLTKKLFSLLIENERIGILNIICHQYLLKFDESRHIQNAKVTTVVPLNDALEIKIQAKIKELTGREAKIKNVIDDSIIGGFILRVGDLQYDASVINSLNTLKRKFNTSNSYVSKI
ncbi:ATP synthase F1 subunit delta [Zunongwangia sp.]|uniref:ATP synthase F1 subunit delta n=1 Tax=Zunongwangia sp. TaxID=1965325 RepID=UPI003AA7EF34